ncbi:hypothetical protein IL306_011695 [Fusarium sp. DS 682]|nr:hypothetical protein IL306_011695 [Fusarium sp. DS 682]
MLENNLPEDNTTTKETAEDGPRFTIEGMAEKEVHEKHESYSDYEDEPQDQEEKPAENEPEKKTAKKVRFTEGSSNKHSQKKESHKHSHKKDSHKDKKRMRSARKNDTPSYWDVAALRQLEYSLIKTRTDLKDVQGKLDKLKDTKKDLRQKKKDLEAEVEVFENSIRRNRSSLRFWS